MGFGFFRELLGIQAFRDSGFSGLWFSGNFLGVLFLGIVVSFLGRLGLGIRAFRDYKFLGFRVSRGSGF